MVKLLLESGADIRKYVTTVPPLVSASSAGNLQLVKLLMSAGADVNTTCEEGATPLRMTSASGSMKIVKLLLENGAKVDVTQVDGLTTAAHLARYYGYQEIEKILTESGEF